MISNQISENSCDKNHFDKAAPDCQLFMELPKIAFLDFV